MRKQYHFRPGPNGLRAWDVDRLVALTNTLPREQVPLTAIRELDEPYWSTGYKHAPTCREVVEHARLIEEADFAFPVILSSDGRVMDGMHRIAKALLQGRGAHIVAVRFRSDPEPDYVGVEPEALPY
jgi:hypothetical protein